VNENYPHYTLQEKTPKEGDVIIAWKGEKRNQVILVNGNLHCWRYKTTPDVFCKLEEITKWRGCYGFDY